MTIQEALSAIDELKPNAYSATEKVGWLSALDGLVKRNVIDTHEDGDDVEFSGYTDDTPGDTVLLIYEPFAEAYLHWLAAKIDYNNNEFARYNNSVTAFNEAYDGFRNDYNRRHLPKGNTIRYF